MQRKSAENENPKCLMVHAICWCRLSSSYVTFVAAPSISNYEMHFYCCLLRCMAVSLLRLSSICVSSLINGDVDNGTRSWSQQNVTCCYQTICELLERWKGKMARTCDQGEETQSGIEKVQTKECLRLEVFFPLNLTHCVPIRAPF